MSVIDSVKKFLMEQEYLEPGEKVDNDESLLESGVIDSVGMVKLVDFLEAAYNIKIDEEDLMPENFDSLEAINDYVTEKRSE